MRVRHRWLWLSISVAAILIVLAIGAGERTVSSRATISFLGYTTNVGNDTRSFALFLVRGDHLATNDLDLLGAEVEGLDGKKAFKFPPSAKLSVVKDPKGGESFEFAVVAPSESRRWRASWLVSHIYLRSRFIDFALRNKLLRANWVRPVVTHLGLTEYCSYVTNNSIWLTNSHPAQKQP